MLLRQNRIFQRAHLSFEKVDVFRVTHIFCKNHENMDEVGGYLMKVRLPDKDPLFTKMLLPWKK